MAIIVRPARDCAYNMKYLSYLSEKNVVLWAWGIVASERVSNFKRQCGLP